MSYRLRWLLLSVCLLLALTGCTISTYSGVTAPPCAAQTATAAVATPTPSRGTRTSGAVVITTDRTVYAPLDGVQVRITNRIRASAGAQGNLVLTPSRRGCPVVWAERLQGSVWEPRRACSASGGGEANLGGTGESTVQPDYTLNAFITAGGDRPDDPAHREPFPTGLYRIAVQYYLAAPPVATIRYGMGGGFIAYSQPFRVCTCGVCA